MNNDNEYISYYKMIINEMKKTYSIPLKPSITYTLWCK